MTIKTLTLTAASAALFAVSSTIAFAGQLPGDFAAIDANADGQVSYQEFSKIATANGGMTRTAAAQKFMKISNGSPFFTENDLMTAVAMQDQPGWGQAYQGTIQPVTTSQPNTAVLSSAEQGDIPRWSDGTPVDLEATDVVTGTDTTRYSSKTASGAYTAPSVTTETTVTTDGTVLDDVTSTENPQMKVWSETGESGAAATTVTTETKITVEPDTGVEVDTEQAMDALEMKEGLEDMSTDMKTNVETPELDIEVEPQPEK